MVGTADPAQQPTRRTQPHWKRFLTVLRALTQRDLAMRYRGSLFGALWALLTPFLMMLLYTVVFSIFLQVRLGGSEHPTSFALALLAGLLPWWAFADAVSRSADTIWQQRNLVKKVAFPLATLPLSVVASALANHLIALSVYLLLVLLLQGAGPTLLVLPAIFLPFAMLTSGCCLILASLGVFIRDVAQLITTFLTAWFFLTPILYDESVVPVAVRPLLRLNPLTPIVLSYRRTIMTQQLPDGAVLLWAYLAALLLLLFGLWWFRRTSSAFADFL